MNLLFATMIMILSFFMVSNSMKVFNYSNNQSMKQRMSIEVNQDALLISQIVRAAYDASEARPSLASPCPTGSVETTVDSVRLCWPRGNGQCVQSANDGNRYCLAADQSLTRSTSSSGGRNTGGGGGRVGGALPIAVRAPNCTTGASCLNCAAAGTTCFSVVLCVGPNASAGCRSGTRVVHSFGFRR